MIPSLEEIIRMLIAGECSSSQATAWLKQHEELAADRVAEDRRMFAAMAMQGMIGSKTVLAFTDTLADEPGFHRATWMAETAVAFADALLAALATGAR
jgi:hypothetical protein